MNNIPSTSDDYRQRWSENTNVPFGTCWCGCGSETRIARVSRSERGQLKGQPVYYVSGHNRSHAACSLTDYAEEDRGFATLCWIWQRTTNGVGYGQLRIGGKLVYAHRHYYEKEHGPIPKGLEIDHLCRNPSCCRPSHLEAVTHSINTRRGVRVTKLNEQSVREIKYFLREGNLNHRQLGDKYGVSKAAIWRIRHGILWSHINLEEVI